MKSVFTIGCSLVLGSVLFTACQPPEGPTPPPTPVEVKAEPENYAADGPDDSEFHITHSRAF